MPSVSAQQFAELGKRHLPRDIDTTTAVATGDVDGDGDLDMVTGNGSWSKSEQNRLYVNRGDGVFTDVTPAKMPVQYDNTSAVVVGDVDGDGDLDLVCGNGGHYGGQHDRLYLNDGSGTFTDASANQMPVDNDYTASLALGDVDGDGDLDLLSGTMGSQNRLYLNDGSGTFTDATATGMPTDTDRTRVIVLGDVDGDGDLDLISGNERQNRLYFNDGRGTFRLASASRMPIDTELTYAVVLGDVDADGDPDIVCGYEKKCRLYLNDGSGTFVDATAAQMPATVVGAPSVALGDVDGDGDLDMVLGTWQKARLYMNDGTGTYADGSTGRLKGTVAVRALADVDGDGDLDLLGIVTLQNQLYLNDGGGTFTNAAVPSLPGAYWRNHSAVFGDVDGDGDLDLVFGRSGQNHLYRNNGRGTFTDVTAAQLPVDILHTMAVALGDVNGDGYPDLICGNGGGWPEQNSLYLNDRTGKFNDATATRMPAISAVTFALALGDVDGDGDLDAVVGNSASPSAGSPNRLYFNDGFGVFTDATAARLPFHAANNTTAIALGDVDGDGDLDAILGNLAAQNRLYVNDGSGVFSDVTALQFPTDTAFTTSVALGDVDSDGDLDLVVGNSVAEQDRLYLNDGSGTFTDVTSARMSINPDSTHTVALADLDDDGDLDLVRLAAGRPVSANTLQFYLNDGGGSFTDATATRLPVDTGNYASIAFGDIDGDGDLDMACGSYNGMFTAPTPTRLYTNLLRQIDAPHLLRIGHDYRLDVYARFGPSRLADVALPYASVAPVNIPLPPMGTLGLDPGSMAALSPFVVPQPAGVQSVTFAVPNSPALVGVPIYTQALLVQYPVQDRLTQVNLDVILR